MKTGIIYTGRLGDIILTLPLAKHLSNNSEVLHYCHAEYADIFKSVSYVKPRIVNERDRSKCYYKAVKLANQECDKVYDNQIWPRLYNKYRESKKQFSDFYYEKFPFIKNNKPEFDIDYDISKYVDNKTLAVSCHANSDGVPVKWDWIQKVIDKFKKKTDISKVVYLCAKGEKSPLDIKHLAGLPLYLIPSILKNIKILLTRNSALSCMATGIPVPTFHIRNIMFTKQDTHKASNLISINNGEKFNAVIDKVISLCE